MGKILHVKKGESLSLQYHNVKDETIMLQSGRLLFETRPAGQEGELTPVEMKPGDVFHITPGTLHRMTGLEDCDILEVSTPGARRRGAPGRPLRPRRNLQALTATTPQKHREHRERQQISVQSPLLVLRACLKAPLLPIPSVSSVSLWRR